MDPRNSTEQSAICSARQVDLAEHVRAASESVSSRIQMGIRRRCGVICDTGAVD